MLRFQFLKVFNSLKNQCLYLSSYTVKEATELKPVGAKVLLQGWVQAVRKHKDIYFVDLVDGTCAERLQIIIQADDKCPSYGSSIKVEGCISQSSHQGQAIELIAETWKEIGHCPSGYPFEYRQQYHTEYVRQFLHLRPRTRRFSSILRVRNAASIAVHNFFQDEGFCFVHTPILTKNDCEGAGDVFSIRVKQNNGDEQNILKQGEQLNPTTSDQILDEKDIFFGSPAFLTVSGQLHLEAMACALSRVYNFGPVFRAENSQTRQHASEFHMIEAEVAFIENLDSLINIVEKCIKNVSQSILNHCKSDIKILSEQNENLTEYIENMTRSSFARLTYDEAIKILQNDSSLKSKVKWGDDMVAEHKKVLVEHCGNIPVFVNMFPKSLKPFYMKTSDKMAHCFDLFAPYGGEICGGSLRENAEEILKEHIESSTLDWYLDLRRYGAVPHGGFGIGFDRLLQSILKISNIRDIIPFPRRKHDCKC